MTKEELEKATGQELIEQRDYCGVYGHYRPYFVKEAGYYRPYLKNVNAEMLKRFNRLAELEKENAELKNRDCWKSCEYANPKAELIGQHIKDVQNLTKAKEILKKYLSIGVGGKITQNDFDLYLGRIKEAEQFLSEMEK